MAFDPITESIAHFVGAFQLAEEEARLRAEYDQIRAERAAEDEAAALELHIPDIKAPHQLKDVAPALDYEAPPDALAFQPSALEALPPSPLLAAGGGPLPTLGPAPDLPAAAPAPAANAGPAVTLTIPPPSSLIAVTSQSAILSDDDSFGTATGEGFAPIAPMIEAVGQLAALAEEMHPVHLDLADAAEDWSAAIPELQAQLPGDVQQQEGPLQVTVVGGPDATGAILVDGARVEALPDWTEFQPAILGDGGAAEPDEDGGPDAAAHDFDADFAEAGPSDGTPDGHAVVAGANTLVNAVDLSSNWLDAPVIAVAGSVTVLDAISQLNVLVDHDAMPEGIAAEGSTATSVAEIVTTTPAPAGEEDGAAEDAGPDGMPANWAVVRIEGDVTQINWVEQYSFVTDNDIAEVSIGGSNTYLGLGENAVLNDANLWQLGFTYDLIMVGGDMIDLSLINQTNVLLDSDVVAPIGTGMAGGGAAGGGSGGGKAAGAMAGKPAADPGAPTGGAAGGAAGKAEKISGTGSDGAAKAGAGTEGLPGKAAAAPASDAPAAKAPAKKAQDAEEADQPAGSGISGGDNLLWNQAKIETVGADDPAPLDSAFADALEDLAGGAETIGAEVAANPLFEGLELLRVLYISGDFVTIDQVTQTNVLGDADQVHLAMEQMAGALQDQIEITTGSNMLGNFATITDGGVSSTVMAGGASYSDALIHQAGLVDTGAAEAGEIQALASEAVAFLADGMMDAPTSEGIAAMTDTMIAETAGQSDVMQTVLA